MKPLVYAGALALFLSVTGAAADQPRILDSLPLEYVQRVQALQKALGSDEDAEAARGVHYAGAAWSVVDTKLAVCFFGGTTEARGLIAKNATDWMRPDLGIAFDFGEPGKFRNCGDDPESQMQIRIAFEDKGWWSAIGADSIISIPQDMPSMNLADFADMTKEKWLDIDSLTVRHEFGHALALMHEHQNPKAPCEEEYDWDKVYEVLGGPPINWPKEVIDFNMRRLDAKHFPATAFNKKSIMLYQFAPNFYKSGEKAECYVPELNAPISKGDFDEVLALYPPEPSERLARAAKVRQNFEERWNRADPQLKSAVGFDPIAAYFERKRN